LWPEFLHLYAAMHASSQLDPPSLGQIETARLRLS
jgi:hypothetical protein